MEKDKVINCPDLYCPDCEVKMEETLLSFYGQRVLYTCPICNKKAYYYDGLIKFTENDIESYNSQPRVLSVMGTDLSYWRDNDMISDRMKSFIESLSPSAEYKNCMWKDDLESARPKEILFNGITTICIFPGGKKIISRPSNDDEFDPEFGVMACIVKRIYGSRSKFKKTVKKGYRQD